MHVLFIVNIYKVVTVILVLFVHHNSVSQIVIKHIYDIFTSNIFSKQKCCTGPGTIEHTCSK